MLMLHNSMSNFYDIDKLGFKGSWLRKGFHTLTTGRKSSSKFLATFGTFYCLWVSLLLILFFQLRIIKVPFNGLLISHCLCLSSKQNDKDGIDPVKMLLDYRQKNLLKWLSWWSKQTRINSIGWFPSDGG